MPPHHSRRSRITPAFSSLAVLADCGSACGRAAGCAWLCAAARKDLEYERRMRVEETEQLRSALASAREEAASLRVECVRMEQEAEREKEAMRQADSEQSQALM